VVVEDDDVDSESEQYVKVQTAGAAPATNGANAEQAEVSDAVRTTVTASPAPSATSTNNSTSSNNSATEFATQLQTLKELGFTNQPLNLFLLKQQGGNIENVVSWLINRLS